MTSKGAHDANLLCIAEIVGAHGIKGMVKLKIFSEEPKDLMRYAPLYDAKQSREFEFENLSQHKNTYLAVLKGVSDRTEAERLRGTKLYITRDTLPEIEEDDTFYYTDLIGLAVKNTDGEPIGYVQQVNDFGAGELLEIVQTSNNQTFLLPFTNACVPNVDLQLKEITVVIPERLLN